MKHPATVLLGFLILSSGCLNYGDYRVESDYSYQGKFKSYKTFDFFNQINVDSSTQNTIIASAIKSRLSLQGYKYDDRKPNLLVSYKIYFDDLVFKGYRQQDIEFWAKSEKEDEEYDPIKYNLREGTLLISLYDRKRENVVWQGYASGVFGSKDYNNERYLKRVVRSIFDQYKFVANGFMASANGPELTDEEEN